MRTQSERRRSYAVIWRTGDGPVRPGKLVFGAKSFRLETGVPGGRSTTEGIRYTDLESVEKASQAERLRGRPTTLVTRGRRDPVAIAALDGPGFGHEITERLAGAVRAAGTS
jgi:hypothetical protein